MSGIYIKDMEMPKKGEYRMTLYVCDDGYAYMDVDLFPVDKDRFEAVSVPPHGRLIGAEKIYDAVEQRYRMSSGIEHRCERDLLDLICAAPTVIEEDEGE